MGLRPEVGTAYLSTCGRAVLEVKQCYTCDDNEGQCRIWYLKTGYNKGYHNRFVIDSDQKILQYFDLKFDPTIQLDEFEHNLLKIACNSNPAT